MSPVRTLRASLRNLAREQEAASKAAQRVSRNLRDRPGRELRAIERDRSAQHGRAS